MTRLLYRSGMIRAAVPDLAPVQSTPLYPVLELRDDDDTGLQLVLDFRPAGGGLWAVAIDDEVAALDLVDALAGALELSVGGLVDELVHLRRRRADLAATVDVPTNGRL
jgi:hypothetical protein